MYTYTSVSSNLKLSKISSKESDSGHNTHNTIHHFKTPKKSSWATVITQQKPLLREMFKEPLIVSYRKGRPLKDILVRAKLERKQGNRHTLSRASLLTLKTNIQKTWLTTKSCRLVSPNLRSIIKRALWTLWGNILQDAFRLPGRMWFENKWNWRKSRSYLDSGEEEVLTKLWNWKSSVWSSRCMEDFF